MAIFNAKTAIASWHQSDKAYCVNFVGHRLTDEGTDEGTTYFHLLKVNQACVLLDECDGKIYKRQLEKGR